MTRGWRFFSIVALTFWAGLSCPAQSTATAAPRAAQSKTASGLDVKVPLIDNSIRFAVIGDSGTGDRQQNDIAQEMERYRQATKFDFVIMLGDNIYGSHTPGDF